MFGRLRRYWRKALELFKRSPYRRQIAVVGRSEEACRQVIAALQDGSKARRLPGGEGEDEQYEALGLHKGKKWLIRGPRKVSDPDRKAWVQDSDTVIVCLGADDLADLGDDNFHIPVNVGAARSQGRLQRVAFAIAGINPRRGPRDESQAQIAIPRSTDPQQYLKPLLVKVRNQPGHPLADQEWSGFIGEVAGSDKLLGTYTKVRDAVGKSIPFFFAADTVGKPLMASSIRHWVESGRLPTKPSTQRSILVCTFGTAMLGVGLLLTSLVLDTKTTAAKFDSYQPVTGRLGQLRTIESDLVRAQAIERAPSTRLVLSITGRESKSPMLAIYLKSFRPFQKQEDGEFQVKRFLAEVSEEAISRLAYTDYQAEYETTVLEELEQFDERWLAEFSLEQRREFGKKYIDRKEQLMVAGILAERKLSKDEELPEKPGHLAAPGAAALRIRDYAQENISDTDFAVRVALLLGEDREAYFSELARLILEASSDSEREALKLRAPSMDASKYFQIVREQSLDWVKQNQPSIKSNLKLLASVASMPELETVSVDDGQEAETLGEEIDEALGRHQIELTVTRPDSDDWHLHFGNEIYLGGPNTLIARDVRFGSVITIRVNDDSEHHYEGSCDTRFVRIRISEALSAFTDPTLSIVVEGAPQWQVNQSEGSDE